MTSLVQLSVSGVAILALHGLGQVGGAQDAFDVQIFIAAKHVRFRRDSERTPLLSI